ncbi:MAG: T9SS type A sorting domain-containing protein [Bacteroidota bacterium]|nr:MAG: T9SS type A sorting domain-containing protein [Bacteroidota bacterium]
MKKLKLTLALSAALLFGAASMHAQSSLNVTGNSAKINGMTFDYSIGEMTLVSTERTSNFIITQGLLQPGNTGSQAPDADGNNILNDLSDRVRLYPNPTDNLLFVELQALVSGECNYELFDATGKVVLSRKETQQEGINKFQLELNALAAGTYYLVLTSPGQENQLQKYSFKIQKVK